MHMTINIGRNVSAFSVIYKSSRFNLLIKSLILNFRHKSLLSWSWSMIMLTIFPMDMPLFLFYLFLSFEIADILLVLIGLRSSWVESSLSPESYIEYFPYPASYWDPTALRQAPYAPPRPPHPHPHTYPNPHRCSAAFWCP